MGLADPCSSGSPDAAVPHKRHTLGIVLIFLTAFIWIVTSFITEGLVSSSGAAAAAIHPFLLTYLASSLFTIYLPLLYFHGWVSEALEARRQRRTKDKATYAAVQQEAPSGAQGTPSKRSTWALRSKEVSPSSTAAMHAAAWAMPFWFAAQFAFNASLALTSVTSNTILSSTSSLFTFFLSILLLKEPFAINTLMAIIACIVGTALVTLSDSESASSGSTSAWGDVLVVLSAALYGGYTVIMRKKMPGEEEGAQVALFFGYLGLFNTVLLAPVVVVLLSMGVFSLSTIPKHAYLIIVLEGLLDYVLSDYLWARAVLLLGPTIATLSLSVQIPMAATAELLLGRATWIYSPQTILMTLVGTALILTGFFGINMGGLASDRGKDSALTAECKSKRSDDGELAHDEEAVGLLLPTVVGGPQLCGTAEASRDGIGNGSERGQTSEKTN